MLLAVALAASQAARAYRAHREGTAPLPGLRVAGVPVVGGDLSAVAAAAETRRVRVRVGEHVETVAVGRLGGRFDPSATRRALARVGRSGDLFADLAARAAARRGAMDLPPALSFDPASGLAFAEDLAGRVASRGRSMRLDLEARRIHPAVPGRAVVPADALSSFAVALATGAQEVRVPFVELPPPRGEDDDRLAGLDISVLLASFETRYSTAPSDRDRAHNLEVGAVAVDGFVLAPGETFSFNEVVGPRTAENGYRYAPGITAGELVDVLGGGICQVSSTLFGAAFFAGLEIVSARPHSRPSSYVDMGLDSTVVYPDVDLRLRNGFDFPVVFHMKVAAGTVRAEVLGARRPYRVVFERDLVEEVPFEQRTRPDPSLAEGARVVVQRGRRGYRMVRRRLFYVGGDLVHTETANLTYPPTVEIVRVGEGPDGERPPPRTFPPLKTPARHLRIAP